MAFHENRLLATLEDWSATIFLLAGGLLLLATANVGLALATDFEGIRLLEAAGFIGIVVAYFGLLGLYPQMAERASRLATTGIVLLLIPVIMTLVDVLGLLFASGPPFAQIAPILVPIGFPLGLAVLGIASLRTATPSTVVGWFLLLFALAWFVILGASRVYGFPISDRLTVVVTALMTIAVLGIGYVLRVRVTPKNRQDSAPKTTP